MLSRMWLGLAGFVVLLVSAGLLIGNGVRQAGAATDHVSQRTRPLETVNLQVRAAFADSQGLLRAYLLTGERRYLMGYARSRAAVTTGMARAAALATGGWRAEVGIQRRAASAWFAFASRAQSLGPGGAAPARLTDQSMGSATVFYFANGRLDRQVAADTAQAVSSGQRALEVSAAWGVAFMGAAFLLGLAMTAGIARGLTLPLAGVTSTLRRLTSGDQHARAEVAGAAEVRDVARSVNALAEETERLRLMEAERTQLREMARNAGLRIREHLRAEDVLAEAQVTMAEYIEADVLYLHLLEEGGIGPPIGQGQRWSPPYDFVRNFGPDDLAPFREAFSRQASVLVQDLRGADSGPIPAEIRAALIRAGIVSQLVTPFGVGADMLGFIAAARMGPGHRWSGPEVEAVESIAADLGRGLHHARMYEAEDRLVGRLKVADQAKSDFLALVSHELRTPLTSIAGYVEVIRDEGAGPLTTQQGRMLEAVDRNTARLRALVEDVLTLSRIESGALGAQTVPVSLAGVAVAAAEAMRPAAERRAIALSCDGAAAGLVVGGNPGQLERVVRSLLSNAVKFTVAGGAVRIRAMASGGRATLTVSDTGIGIPDADLAEVFDRFFRASNAVERSIQGSGLGLAIARAIVANHGGDVTLESCVGKGTTVTVSIPLLGSGHTAFGAASGPASAQGGQPG
jgi:signal transduction histidine kinase